MAALLVAGGFKSVAPYQPQLEVLDEGRGADPAWRPVVNSPAAGAALPGSTVTLSGALLRGVTLGPCGEPYQAATNFPIISLERLDDGERWVAGSSSWHATSTNVSIPARAPRGWYVVRPTVNAIDGVGAALYIGQLPDSGTPDAGTADAGTVDAGTGGGAGGGSGTGGGAATGGGSAATGGGSAATGGGTAAAGGGSAAAGGGSAATGGGSAATGGGTAATGGGLGDRRRLGDRRAAW